MKKQLTLLFLLVACSFSFSADREVRSIEPFNSVHVGGGIDVYIHTDDDFRVEIESEDSEDIITEVDGDILNVRYKNGWSFFKWDRHDNVHVYLPDLEEVVSSGGADVYGTNKIKGDFLELRSSGGSDIKMEIDMKDVNVVSSGGSDVILSGTARFFKAESSGGSDVKGYELIAGEADLHSSGGSDIQITVEKRLKAKASGGSDIYYQGNPEYVNIDSGSGGDVHHR